MSNPFAPSTSKPGYGSILLSLLPPATPVLQTCSYQYPLKLIAPDPLTAYDEKTVHTIFLLTYGGGLVAGDSVNLSIHLAPTTRLVLLTQGSTKIFKSPSADIISRQNLTVHLQAGASLCYLPDPVQPFERSAFEQTQVYSIVEDASLCICDWVCRGRTARGEDWRFYKYTSKNEVFLAQKEDDAIAKKRLLLRDNVLLEGGSVESSFAGRIDNLGVFGTLIIRGPMFEGLGRYFMDEFEKLPRIGIKKWDSDLDGSGEKLDEVEIRRKRRQKQEVQDELLWTAANVRGFVLIKFGAREVEGVKKWMSTMIKAEGSVERHFGERAILCLR